MSLGTTGCPFVLPFIEVEENVPPRIIQSSPAEGDVLRVDTEQYVAFVLVDDDDTELDFAWTIAPFGIQGDATPVRSGNLVGSQLVVERDEDWDGRELVVTVWDPQGASDSRSWIVEIPESAR